MTIRPRLSATNARLWFRSLLFARRLSLLCLPIAAGCSGLDSRIGGLKPHDGSQGQDVGTGSQDAGTGSTPDLGTGPNAHAPITSSDQLDLLFMIDNSLSMAPLQAKLAQRLGDFMNILKLLPGGLPSVHIAVVSSSLGAGRFANVPGCGQSTPENGGGAFMRPDNCTMIAAGQKFISAERGVNNFSGDITDAFGCITQVGDTGCGFEHQFASTIAALQKASYPLDPDNGGFLRKNAFLGIVMLTNEDDCSTPLDFSSDLFNPSVEKVADPSGLGGLQSYRCNEFGHLCNGAPPPHVPPAAGTTVTLTGCTSSEGMSPGPGGSAPDPLHQLTRVEDFVRFLKGLKDDPSRVFVAALAGAPSPYKVGGNNFQLGSGASEVQPMIQHSCSSAAGDYADPAVRVAEFIQAFGPNGVFETICADDFKPAMTAIGNAMVGMMAPQGGSTDAGAGDAGNGGGPSCRATCATPAGTVQPFASVTEVYAAMVGLWQICAGSRSTFSGAPADTIGVEYGPASSTPTAIGSTVGGNMYYLVQGPSGPVRGSGFAYQLTYDVSPEGPPFQLNMHPAPNSGFGGSFRYSPCPTEFEIAGGSANPTGTAILVQF